MLSNRFSEQRWEAKPTILPDLGQTINGPFVAGVGITNYQLALPEETNKSPVRAEP
jgi:hypothetical protein